MRVGDKMAIFFPVSHFKLSKTGKNFNIFFIISAVVILTAFVVTLFFWKPGSGLPNRGVWNGRTYSDSGTGVFLTVPDSWQIMSDAEIIESFKYSSNIYKDLQEYSDYVDAFICKSDDSKLYIRYYDAGTTPRTTSEEAKQSARQLGNSVKYKGTQFKVMAEEILAVEIGGLAYERFAYTLYGIDNATFIEYYRCLEGETGKIFVQLNLTVFDQTSEEEFLALFQQI